MKARVVKIESDDAVRLEPWRAIMPAPPAGTCDVVPRVIRTGLVERLQGRAGEAVERAERLRAEIMGTARGGAAPTSRRRSRARRPA